MEIAPDYSDWKYTRRGVQARADDVVKAVLELCDSDTFSFDGVVLTGSSGTWLGGILQAHPQWPDRIALVLCRKDGERSHGSTFEGLCRRVHRLVLVDDFVESGATAIRVMRGLEERSAALVAVLEHKYLGGSLLLRERQASSGWDWHDLNVPVLRRH